MRRSSTERVTVMQHPDEGTIHAWLDGDAAQAVTCDAALTPIVTGDVDTGALDELVQLCVQLSRVEHAADKARGAGEAGEAGAGTDRSRQALQQAIIGKAVFANWPLDIVGPIRGPDYGPEWRNHQPAE